MQPTSESFSEADTAFEWYHSLPSKRIDLVDDYASNELFLIEFDSLLLRCFSQSNIDFRNGFQLLHAVHVIEKLLSDLLLRKCRFQIICFNEHERLCIPAGVGKEEVPRYQLARAVVIRHILTNLPTDCRVEFNRFDSLRGGDFETYLDGSDAYFIMIHDGGLAEDMQKNGVTTLAPKKGLDIIPSRLGTDWPLATHKEVPTDTTLKKLSFRAMIAWFLANKHDVALITEIQFLDSKILTYILEHSDSEKISEITLQHAKIAGIESPLPIRLDTIEGLDNFSEADLVTIVALHSVLVARQISKDDVLLFLLHTAALFVLPLSSRHLRFCINTGSYMHTISSFSKSALSVLSSSEFIAQLDHLNVRCNLVDLVDGLLLSKILADAEFRSALLMQESIKKKLNSLFVALLQYGGSSVNIEMELPRCTNRETLVSETVSDDGVILSFKNPAFESHFNPINLKTEDVPRASSTAQVQIFKELSYWCSRDKAPVRKGQVERQDEKDALTQNQNFQKEIQLYAASLTNAFGKVLEPRIIVASSSSHNRQFTPHMLPKPQEPTGGANGFLKQGKKPGNPNKKGGKMAALEAAAKMKAISRRPKNDMKNEFWKLQCQKILTKDDLTARHKMGLQYLQSLDETDELGPEIQLFTVDCLFRILVDDKSLEDKPNITALIWDSIHRLSKAVAGVTPEVTLALEIITKSLGFPGIKIKTSAPSRPLAFSCLDPKTMKRPEYSLPSNPVEFQLENCGPYLDRTFDSAPDSRVPFQPDGWQRRVLDAIDSNQSLLVIAPTSAGKTFISFYAMEKVLKADDEGVLVYVAPTTALVNQIAAEIHGRFSKNYKHAGRSVWAIYTRDHCINNSTGCQILVTVPHILQEMLLAPLHAEKKNSWSTRIKRIIFDEIHCIGQAKDGVIWQQLLLQAPCPIIALSATVGNPRELSDWLSSTERANSNELVTVQHRHRYSHLRNFIYVPPRSFCFSGLPPLPNIYIPGLDGSDAFIFVHPVASLAKKEKEMPDDLSLEARDCLRLWQTLSEHATEKHKIPSTLHPDKMLPQLVKKTDVIKWEKELKIVLRRWMGDETSPFDLVRRDLGSALRHLAARDIMSTNNSCGANCVHREVNSKNLATMMMPVLVDLHAKDALPCLVFNYDRIVCETLAHSILDELVDTESAWKKSKPSWLKTLTDFEQYQKELEITRSRAAKAPKKEPKKKKRRGEDEDDEKVSRAERIRDHAEADISVWAGFNPDAPLDGFHFADMTKLAMSELADIQSELYACKLPEWLVRGLERGIGVHHSGMNRKYLQTVEILFRRGFLRVVLATGTLALGINMPCKTVVFAGDSISLTALNFRQAAGRAGRRGFDVLGNVVYVGITMEKVFRLLSSRLPDIRTQYPINTSFVLRLAVLLHGSNNSSFALKTINSIFSRPHLYLGLPASKITVRHYLRFSIEYLRRQFLLDAGGLPVNFANCISPLYYTGSSIWAFHALLSKGYFHELCKDIEVNPERVLTTLMLVMSHIFERQPCAISAAEFTNDLIKRSSSIVFLPSLPAAAKEVLDSHNAETLSLFKLYAKSYITQYITGKDDALSLTRYRVESKSPSEVPFSICAPPPIVRSPFVALSGHGDEFSTIPELCSTMRSGVFLEEAILPYLHIYVEGVDPPLNAYLLDFFKHGDIKTIEKANKIQASELHLRLNEFIMILHTIVVCLTELTKSIPLPNPGNFEDSRNGSEDRKSERWSHGEMDEKGLLSVRRAFIELHAEFEVKLQKMAVKAS